MCVDRNSHLVSFFDLTTPQIYKYLFVEILPNIYLASNLEIYICGTPASGPKVTEPLPKGLLAALSKPLPLKQNTNHDHEVFIQT